MDEQIIPVNTESMDSNESIDSNESLETCIICLDDVGSDTIYFPCKYSSCSCRYNIHLMCIKENNINGCIICKSRIVYPVQNELIQIDMFQKNNTDVDVVLDVDINTRTLDVNIYRHTTRGDCDCIDKKVCVTIFSILAFILCSTLIWFMVNQFSE